MTAKHVSTRRSRPIAPAVRDFIHAHPWWQTAVFALGVLALLTATSVLFLGLNNAPTAIVTSEPVPPVDSMQLAVAISHLVNAPIEHGGTVEILHNGDGFLPALIRDIGSARKTIPTIGAT